MSAPENLTWETEEVETWLANDEDLYLAAAEVVDERELSRLVRARLAGEAIDFTLVDWEYLLHDSDLVGGAA